MLSSDGLKGSRRCGLFRAGRGLRSLSMRLRLGLLAPRRLRRGWRWGRMRILLELLIKDNDRVRDEIGRDYYFCISSSVRSLLCLLLYLKRRMKDKEFAMKALGAYLLVSGDCRTMEQE